MPLWEYDLVVFWKESPINAKSLYWSHVQMCIYIYLLNVINSSQRQWRPSESKSLVDIRIDEWRLRIVTLYGLP